MNFLTASVNHICHKVFPFLIITYLLHATIGFTSWPPYIILCLLIFSEKYNYKIGYHACFVQNVLSPTTLLQQEIQNETKSKMEE